MVVAILFLLVFADVSSSLDSTKDPSGWNSYFATEHSNNIDAVDVVDPSGWNYNRGTKSSERRNEIKNDPAQEVATFCQRVVERGISETNPMIEEEMSVAVKTKVSEFFSQKKDVKENVAFIKRFISILLNTADLTNRHLEEGSDIDVSGVIEIKVSPDHLKTLTDFINSDVNVSMRELDSILSASIHKKYISTFSVSDLIDKIFFMIRQKEIWLPVVLVLIVLFVFRLLLINKTTTCLVSSLLILIFTVSYVVEYYRLYKEVEIKQKIILDKHSEIPSTCDPRNQQWWSALFKSFGFSKDEKEECVEYYKAVLLDPLVEVSPSRVLSNILSDFVLSPFGKIGEAIAGFTSAILGGLPFYYGWIVWLGSSVAIFVIIALIIVMCIGGKIQLFWPFSGVSISPPAPRAPLPPAAPAISTTPVTRSTSQPLLEAVSGMSNFVLMDADSLGALVLRAQTSLSTVHSGVQELNRPPKEVLPSKQSNEKVDFNKLQQERTDKENSDLNTVSETFIKKQRFDSDVITSVVEEDCELRSTKSAQVTEVLGTTEVIQSDLASSGLEDTMMESESGNIEKHASETTITRGVD